MLSGVADLTLIGSFGIVHIELKRPPVMKWSEKSKRMIIKTAGGTLSDNQKSFKKAVEAFGQPYHVCDNLEDFQKIVKMYI